MLGFADFSKAIAETRYDYIPAFKLTTIYGKLQSDCRKILFRTDKWCVRHLLIALLVAVGTMGLQVQQEWIGAFAPMR